MPVSFNDPIDPVPAKVVTTPVEITTLRIVLDDSSVTYKFLPSVVIPIGLLKLDEVPVPSTERDVPLPAKVDTTLVEIVLLQMELENSIA